MFTPAAALDRTRISPWPLLDTKLGLFGFAMGLFCALPIDDKGFIGFVSSLFSALRKNSWEGPF
jgi:hypothetical protein